MRRKRLVGVVTVRNGWAVQSIGYHRYLPLGRPECLVENLDRWGADEILVQVIDRSIMNIGPDFDLLYKLGKLGLGTPLIYSGGIRSVVDGLKLVELGADRVVVDSLLHDNTILVKELSEKLGAQALIASLPLSWQADELAWLDYRSKRLTSLSSEVLGLIQLGVVSESLVIDWQHEGVRGSFDQRLLDSVFLKGIPIIAFGGVSEVEQMSILLRRKSISAVAVGNFLSYREDAIQGYKEALIGMSMRPAAYQAQFPLLTKADV